MNNNIPEVFKNQDTIYHYTSVNTAIEYILFEKELRFSPRKSSFDPIENSWHMISEGIGYYTEEERMEIEAKTKLDASVIKNDLKIKLDVAKQLCFCKNRLAEDFRGQGVLPNEYFGFMKPRMWDQYGDRYKGVCLSFSKEKLIEIHNGISNDIDYVNYSHLSFNHISIDHNQLYSKGIDEYGKICDDRLNRILFRKHQDYSGENEFRMYSFNDKQYDYIDISSAINGIIVSKQNLSKFSEQQLIKFSEDMNIEMLYLNWTNSKVSVQTLKESQKVYKITSEAFKQIADK